MSNSLTSVKQINGKRIWYNDTYTDENVYNSICTAKARLLLKHPFWGFMGLDLVLIESPIADIDTLATDGYHIFYSAKFISGLTLEELEFAVCHEIYHCIFGHTSGKDKVQRKHADWVAKLWNKACDFVINFDLVDAGVGGTTIKYGKHHIGDIQICYDAKYKGMSAEEVYFDLVENDDDDESETLDQHIEIEISDDSDQSGDSDDGGTEGSTGGSDGDGSGSIKVTMTAAEYGAEKARWQTTAEQAVANAMQSSQTAGSIPAHLKRLIGDLHKPKISWPVVLRKFVSQIRSTGYSWTRPAKNSYGAAVLPSFRRSIDKLEIAVAFDTSGSVGSDALNKFISEFFGILKGYQSYSIHAFCFEGSVNESTYMKIESFDGDAQKNLAAYVEKVSGGGGTSFQSVWDFMRYKKIKPKGLVLFTDGYPCSDDYTKEYNYCPTLFLTVGNRNNWKAPFGVSLQYESV
jgi:predicted metal-dependent peptidase